VTRHLPHRKHPYRPPSRPALPCSAQVKLSIITPSLNQGAYIERTIESVLSQGGGFELEYVIVDGGSMDETPSILRRYEGRARIITEPDRGQSDALNKGLRLATGDVLAWLNSDDTYAPGALDAVARTFADTGARWCFGDCRIVDEHDCETRRAVSAYKAWVARRYSLRRLLARNFIPQPATFFRRDLLEEAGPLDDGLHLAMDYDLWLRFARLATPVHVPRQLASFRMYPRSKTVGQSHRMVRECFGIARRHASGLEKLALAEHLLHAGVQLAAYRAYDALRATSSRP
jgi:glycosyltransferase involved in cell wall biosynthesis